MKGKKTGGRKKGTPNKEHPITMEVVSTLRNMGYDPVAFQAKMARHAWNRYLKCLTKKNEYGANGALHAAIQANGDIMKYVYPTRKAIDHNVSGGVVISSFADAMLAIDGPDDEGELKDVGPTTSSEE